MNHIDVATSRRPAFNPTGCPEGVEPRLWREAVSARVETHLAMATALLALLDSRDGDCDLEPSLLSIDDLEGDGIDHGDFNGEGTDGNPDDEDDGDAEPSLGSTERTMIHVLSFGWMEGRDGVEHRVGSGQQLDWAGSGRLDLEASEGDDEPDIDDEPSLGSPELAPAAQYLYADERGNISVFQFQGSQERWANGTPGASDQEEEAVNEDGDECEGGA